MVAQLRLAKHVSQSNFEAMASSRFLVATRAFVKVLLALARTYELALQVNRESSAEQLVKAYKKVLLKARPDKGGRKEDVQRLQEVKETSATSGNIYSLTSPTISNRDLFFAGARQPKTTLRRDESSFRID